MKATFVLCLLPVVVAGLLAAPAQAAIKDCPRKAGFITMASINWDNTGGLREGRAESAAAAEAFCAQNKHCYAWNDAGYWMLEPPTTFAGFYPYEILCTYMKAGQKH